MFAKFKERMTRQALVSSAQDMSDRDLSDLGVSREQLVNYSKISNDVPARMSKMADVFDVDMATLQRRRDSYLDAVEACHSCGAVKVCRKALAAKGTDKATPEDVDFCPNASLYTEMARS